MSPEQSIAEAEIDGRSDIYALGCVLYEMLAGAPPFTGLSCAGDPACGTPPIRCRACARARPEVPTAIEERSMKALAKDPAERFASAAEFAVASKSSSGESRSHRGGRRAHGAAERQRRDAAAFRRRAPLRQHEH